MTHATRRRFLGATAALAIGLTGSVTASWAAGDYPTGPLTMYVGYAAGGQTDLVARATAKVMSEQLGVPINVVNKPGAGGAVAARELKKAKPDGYTLLFHANTVLTSAPLIMKRIDYTIDDFEFAGMITAYQAGLVTHKESPFDTLSEFVTWAKANPGFSYGSLSPESRMYMEEIAKKENLDVNIVPLKGGGAMLNAVLGKQVVLALSGGIHYKYPDQIKMVTALTTFRHPSAPDVMTIEENGYDLGMDTRTTLILPKGTPRAIRAKLADALKAAETDASFKKIVAAANIPIMYLGLDESTKEMHDSFAKNKGILERVGLIAK